MIRMTRVTVTAKAPPPSRIAVGEGLPDKCDRIPVRRPAITPTSRARMIRRALTLRLQIPVSHHGVWAFIKTSTSPGNPGYPNPAAGQEHGDNPAAPAPTASGDGAPC